MKEVTGLNDEQAQQMLTELENILPKDEKDALDCEYSQENQGTRAKQMMISLWFVSNACKGQKTKRKELNDRDYDFLKRIAMLSRAKLS